jgi:hypothetical protein
MEAIVQPRRWADVPAKAAERLLAALGQARRA